MSDGGGQAQAGDRGGQRVDIHAVHAGQDQPGRLLQWVDGAAGRGLAGHRARTHRPGGVPGPQVVHRADQEVAGAAGRVDQPQRQLVAEFGGGRDEAAVQDQVGDEVWCLDQRVAAASVRGQVLQQVADRPAGDRRGIAADRRIRQGGRFAGTSRSVRCTRTDMVCRPRASGCRPDAAAIGWTGGPPAAGRRGPATGRRFPGCGPPGGPLLISGGTRPWSSAHTATADTYTQAAAMSRRCCCSAWPRERSASSPR
jgi:hypothetical protein